MIIIASHDETEGNQQLKVEMIIIASDYETEGTPFSSNPTRPGWVAGGAGGQIYWEIAFLYAIGSWTAPAAEPSDELAGAVQKDFYEITELRAEITEVIKVFTKDLIGEDGEKERQVAMEVV
ncbi:hypothetical protein EYF80_006354 [Liparis tanakae]|uniref:Uncharacterized protein n=1 Tax=Liparis tanakae TaxID=230148 RepID=A0A4Z2J1P9_9TELE|nr:hypothetical protein EYF80_006354 [Liparis tanakae]